jgi:hypothetical protein
MMAQDRCGWTPLLVVRDSIAVLIRNVRMLTRQRRRLLANGMNPGLVQPFTTGLHRVHERMWLYASAV